MLLTVGSKMIQLRFLGSGVIEGQDRGVRWQTEVVCQKRIRGLLRATKRFFSNKHQDQSDEFQPLENFVLLANGGDSCNWLHAHQAHLFQ